MKFVHFLKKGFYLLLIFAIFLTIFNFVKFEWLNIYFAGTGILIAFLNYTAGAAILCRGIAKNDKTFFSAFLTGMLLRFFIMFSLLFILIKVLNFETISLVGALILAYFAFLTIEIVSIWKYSSLKSSKL